MNPYLSYLFVYYSIFLSNAILLVALRNKILKKWSSADELLAVLLFIITAQLFSLLYAFHPIMLFSNLFFDILLLFLAKAKFNNYSYSGMSLYLANCLMVVVGIGWGIEFLTFLHVSLMTKLLLAATSPLLLLTVPSDVIQMLEQYDVLCRETWHRPRNPYPVRTQSREPKVSLHVPVHSEPADIVIGTLNRLAKLEYTNYEVIVVDNNTKDPGLWLPVKAHCEKLGKKFKFFHVENLPGAKGGALNYALEHTDPASEVIGVIDADYHANRTFLKALVGYFDNPKMGFVQTPHDYRSWRKNLYLKMCYWEYKIFFHTTLVAMNERDATLTVGTMCLINKQALIAAGGWSEWCVTEDSELAIRIHDAGYSSVYVNKTYGRGLIPETFAGYKKQRYRWTAGPVQELQYHGKHFLGLSKKQSQFSLLQRIHHFNHGLDNVIIGFTIPLTLVSVATMSSMVLHHEIVPVPFELWLAATVLLISSTLLDYLMYTVVLKADIGAVIGKKIASKALGHTITLSAFRTLFTGSAQWNRTNKFKVKHSYKNALLSTKEELFIGITLTAFIFTTFLVLPYTGLLLMFLIGMTYTALGYLAAPLLSIINVWAMTRKEKYFDIPYIKPVFIYPKLADIFN